jgi:hypothetical protein
MFNFLLTRSWHTTDQSVILNYHTDTMVSGLQTPSADTNCQNCSLPHFCKSNGDKHKEQLTKFVVCYACLRQLLHYTFYCEMNLIQFPFLLVSNNGLEGVEIVRYEVCSESLLTERETKISTEQGTVFLQNKLP